MIDRGSILLVTWDGGGNVPPMLALGRRLAQRGHEVHVIGSPSLADRVARRGFAFTTLARVPELDLSAGFAIEDQVEVFLRELTGPELSDDVADAIDRQHHDVVVIDCMQMAAFNAAEARRVSTVALVHYLIRFALAPSEARSRAAPVLNVSRESFGLNLLDPAIGTYEQLWQRCDLVLAATLQPFDDAPNPVPANLHYVGPILDPDPPEWEWDLPWPPDHPDPLVVVSFSTTYQHQEHQLQRALDALARLRVRTLVTLGPGLQPADIDAPAGTVVREWIPHTAVLPHASLLVTHAGHSTIMSALACAVPIVCVPTGRDQLVNAGRVQDCNLGIGLEPDATADEIRAAIETVLASPAYKLAIEDTAAMLHRVCADEPATNEVEALISHLHA